MKRVYSGTGTGTAIIWTLQSDVRFVYHGWNLMAEVEMIPTAADAPRRTLVQAQMPYVRRSYMWGPDMSGTLDGAGGVGGLLAMRRHERGTQSTETFWATHDLNGNIIGLVQLPVTGSQPAKMAVYDYDAFGQLTRVNEPEANFNPIRFSSKYTDSETGLVYYGYRYLSPELGRWISRDPIGDGHDGSIVLAIACASKYNMVANDTLNVIDVYGLDLSLPTSSCCARSAIPVALADGPEPGPADAISLGILAAAAGLWIGETLTEYAVDPLLDVLIPTDLPADTCGVCPPCPPAPNGGARVDYVPPSTPHWPCLGDHTHLWYFEMHQIPYPNCSCFAKKIKWVKCNDTGVWHDEN